MKKNESKNDEIYNSERFEYQESFDDEKNDNIGNFDVEGDEIPETDREFMYRLIEPDVPFSHIRRDIGLSKISKSEIDLCLLYFEIARRARHMSFLSQEKNPSIFRAMKRLENNYIEKIYEILDIKRSEGGFQWEALNRKIKELRKSQEEKKKGWMRQQTENQ